MAGTTNGNNVFIFLDENTVPLCNSSSFLGTDTKTSSAVMSLNVRQHKSTHTNNAYGK